MLYYIFRWLDQFGVSGSHLWSYISFRSILALVLALVISAWFGEKFIKYLKRKQITETARDEKIDPFGVNKVGVPSMGGIIIIVALLIPVILLGRLRNIYLILMIVTTVWLGFLGGMDDFIKIFRHNKEGLKGKYKIVGQVSIGLIVGLVLWASPDVKSNLNMELGQKNGQEIVVKHSEKAEKTLKTTIPFVKNHNLDYSKVMGFCGEHSVAAGWILFVIMTIFVVTAVSNGANLTDGLDGLATGVSAVIIVIMGAFAYLSGNIIYSDYLNIMYIPGAGELTVFAAALVGALIGFLWYNCYPAQVFMGDTGSLALGGIIAVFALLVRKELLLPLLCGVFLVESFSVMMQVGWFKYTKRRYGEGRRILLMSPVHHHYQKKGIFETKIVLRFWIISLLLAAITLVTLKIR